MIAYSTFTMAMMDWALQHLHFNLAFFGMNCRDCIFNFSASLKRQIHYLLSLVVVDLPMG